MKNESLQNNLGLFRAKSNDKAIINAVSGSTGGS
jgi:hypothetical protein